MGWSQSRGWPIARAPLASPLALLLLASTACEALAPDPDSPDPLRATDDRATATTPSGCPLGPPGKRDEAVEAIEELNRIRRAAGLPCVEPVPAIALAAERHCQYHAANTGGCIDNPHREASACPSFVGATFGDRLRRAGYSGLPRFEVMAYVGAGRTAVRLWLDSVWHRLPLLSPQVEHAGYGSAGRCDTMDFGVGRGSVTARQNVVYPHGGQRGVPREWSGRESPEPPPPPGGWPSGYPITLYAANLTVARHQIFAHGSSENLEHVFLAPGGPGTEGLLVDEFMLYTFRPLVPRTRYRVLIEGTQDGVPTRFDWTFTTR